MQSYGEVNNDSTQVHDLKLEASKIIHINTPLIAYTAHAFITTEAETFKQIVTGDESLLLVSMYKFHS